MQYQTIESSYYAIFVCHTANINWELAVKVYKKSDIIGEFFSITKINGAEVLN